MAVPARSAATVILLRDAPAGMEVLLLRRTPHARFMPGNWVFPGGAVDPGEDERAAAVREVAEEAGIRLPDAAALVPYSRWITPDGHPVRFDTHFFLAPLPEGQEARADGSEMVDARWLAPRAALDANTAGELPLVFPTLKHLESLSRFTGSRALLTWAAGREIITVQPVIVGDGPHDRIVVPGWPDAAP